MNMTFNWSLYQSREQAARLGTLLVGIIILAVAYKVPMQYDEKIAERAISLTIMAHAVAPEQIVQHIAQPTSPLNPVDLLSPAIPLAEIPLPAHETPAVATPPVTSKINPPVSAAEVVSQARAVDVAAEMEAAYAAKLKSYLASVKRYPTGREASMRRPSGKSVIWFVLLRNGELLEAGIEMSSNSMLLDDAALSTVRRAKYPSFPDNAWLGQDRHKFSVVLDFIPPST